MGHRNALRRLFSGPSGKQFLVGAALLLLGASLHPTATYVGRRVWGSRPPARLDDVTPFLDDAERIFSRLDVDLGGSRVPESVVVAVGSPDAEGIAPTRVVLVGWDSIARRWTALFDSSRRRHGYPAEAVFEPADLDPSELQVVPFRGRPGHRDLAINANLRTGRQATVVLTLDQQVVDLAYYGRATGRGGIAAAGPREHQTLRVTGWVDTRSGPVRTHVFEVAYDEDPYVEQYDVVTDDRSWLGACLASDDRFGAVVAEVETDSPAVAGLRPGDVIMGFAGTREDLGGDDIVKELARRRSGDGVTLRVRGGGIERPVRLRLGSWSHASPLGLREPILDARIASTTRGVQVDDVAGPLRDAGLRDGDRIVRVGDVVVNRIADLYIALATSYEDHPVVTVATGNRTRRVVLTYESIDPADPDRTNDHLVLHAV